MLLQFLLLLHSPPADPEAPERDVLEDQQGSWGHQGLQGQQQQTRARRRSSSVSNMTAAKGDCHSAHIHTHSMQGRVEWLVCNHQEQARLPACSAAAVSHLQRHCSIRDVCAAAPACQQRHQSVTAVPSRQKQAGRSRRGCLPPCWRLCSLGQCTAAIAAAGRQLTLHISHLNTFAIAAAELPPTQFRARAGCGSPEAAAQQVSHTASASAQPQNSNSVLRAAWPHQLLACAGAQCERGVQHSAQSPAAVPATQ